MMKKVRQALEDVLYPCGISCLGCGRPAYGEALCPPCAAALEELRLIGPRCPRCGYPMREDVCGGCRGRGDVYIHAAYGYEGVARRLVHEMKFQCVADAADILAEGMAEEAQRLQLAEDTVVTWVPSPRWRTLERGIDHGRVLAACVAQRLKLPVRPLLRSLKKRGDAAQHQLGRAQRLQNLLGSMEALPDMPGNILLVDDVATTGATIQACVACLTGAGAQKVTVLAAARTFLGEEKEKDP